MKKLNITLLFLLLIALFVMDLLMGSVSLSLEELWLAIVSNNSDSPASLILFQFRLPRAITCVLVGAALSTGGLMMQTLFRNPLAGPDVLGLTSGAGLMVALLLMGSFIPLIAHSPWGVASAATIGSGAVFVIITVIAKRIKDHAALLIVGLMIGAAASSLVSILQYISQSDELKAYTLWALGSVDSTSHEELAVMSIALIPAMLFSLTLVKSLNALLWGENYATSMGINVNQARLFIIGVTSVLTGVTTAFCGPIAFIGIAVPHLVKFITPTSNHKTLMLHIMIGGACILLGCDIVRQLSSHVQTLPLNAITSLVGAPVVIWVVIKFKNLRTG